jgi:hypothetical protein
VCHLAIEPHDPAVSPPVADALLLEDPVDLGSETMRFLDGIGTACALDDLGRLLKHGIDVVQDLRVRTMGEVSRELLVAGPELGAPFGIREVDEHRAPVRRQQVLVELVECVSRVVDCLAHGRAPIEVLHRRLRPAEDARSKRLREYAASGLSLDERARWANDARFAQPELDAHVARIGTRPALVVKL